MIQTEQTVVTPCGPFIAMWDDNEDVPVSYRGDADAVEYFKTYLALNVVSGRGGAILEFASLEPADLYGFCQSREYGIMVLPSADDLISSAADDAEPDHE